MLSARKVRETDPDPVFLLHGDDRHQGSSRRSVRQVAIVEIVSSTGLEAVRTPAGKEPVGPPRAGLSLPGRLTSTVSRWEPAEDPAVVHRALLDVVLAPASGSSGRHPHLAAPLRQPAPRAPPATGHRGGARGLHAVGRRDRTVSTATILGLRSHAHRSAGNHDTRRDTCSTASLR